MSNQPIGYSALIEKLTLKVNPHHVASYVALQGRGHTDFDQNRQVRVYPKSYALKDPDNVLSHLEFALKHEGINLEIAQELFLLIDKRTICQHIQLQPTGKYNRIIWFLYEFLIKVRLDLEDCKKLNYVDLLDSEQYFTLPGIKSPRHAINNNLLGDQEFCPIIRRTHKLTTYIEKHFDIEAQKIAKQYDPKLISRASYYLYAKETRSSYAIEREKPSKKRIQRFVEILKKAPSIQHLSKEILVELQNAIVDPRFKDEDYRKSQNYIGENISEYQQKIHYISPKPEDVPALMSGLLAVLEKVSKIEFPPVILAATISFAFVFIHPFEDGNGRIHRFLIHYILSRLLFTPQNIIFPVSAVMLQKIRDYDRILEEFSEPLMRNISDYDWSDDGILVINQPTLHFYQFVDFTRFSEYLFECIEETLLNHFANEIQFLLNYDRTKSAMQDVIDMPDHLIDLFMRSVAQNQGKLGSQKRQKHFEQLSDDEISKLESILKTYMLSRNSDN